MARTDFQFGEIPARLDMLTPTRVPQERERAEQCRGERDMTQLVDNTLEDSFPASDPPSWTASVVRPAPTRDGMGLALPRWFEWRRSLVNRLQGEPEDVGVHPRDDVIATLDASAT
jgi:hypothetical protein